MECQWTENNLTDVSKPSEPFEENPICFQTKFIGYMEMYSDQQTVINYLNAHQGWFCRCAEPMKTEAMGENGYILSVGRFSSFGYEVEPKIAVVLLSSQDGIYLMNTIPFPEESNLGYEIDYKASMQLEEVSAKLAGEGIVKAYKKQGFSQLPDVITKVRWQLQMDVAIQFPKFIHKLPLRVIQQTGDSLLSQIIRQISPRLTYKVQEDFHTYRHLPVPPKNSCYLEKVMVSKEKATFKSLFKD
ncbi:MAG: DUF1997 domain-containing protein [cyanobacterium endosymbiont of Rhopalodia musculus]|uniref:DUF1997 domain-containing protein n=1 Tax=cyanobacterium endosymbiont of Epithemia clementina EcSB TaxID=3034674 RepID=UPI00248009CD|nr:DUF1997 domain-containing protein [cyanobacterium endosymbiont of Epithemia clementina EcSB]WGT68115.1 DUF1997 domain-containing protein [cyanobacterium endosymbiont of Epithemia clementina EcSB]